MAGVKREHPASLRVGLLEPHFKWGALGQALEGGDDVRRLQK